MNLGVQRVIVALAVAMALSSLALTCTPVKAATGLLDDMPQASTPGDQNNSFTSWIFMSFKEPLGIFIAIFLAGALVGAGFTYLEYHIFKITFEQMGKILLFVLPLLAVGAIAATLILHKYNLFLLSLYLDVPLIGGPIFYLIYKKYLAGESE